MASDPYTMDMRLCDDDGMVSNEPIDDGKPSTDKTYLDRLNRLRNISLTYRGDKPEFLTEPFTCTGDAHLAYEHIRCTSRAHVKPMCSALLAAGITTDPYDTSPITVSCTCGNPAIVMRIAHKDDCPVKRVLDIVEPASING